MKIRIAVALVNGEYCAHGFSGATDEQIADCVRSKKLKNKVPVRFFEVSIPAERRLVAKERRRRSA